MHDCRPIIEGRKRSNETNSSNRPSIGRPSSDPCKRPVLISGTEAKPRAARAERLFCRDLEADRRNQAKSVYPRWTKVRIHGAARMDAGWILSGGTLLRGEPMERDDDYRI